MSKPIDYRVRLEVLGEKMVEHYEHVLAVVEGTEEADTQRDLAATMEFQQEFADIMLEAQEDEEMFHLKEYEPWRG